MRLKTFFFKKKMSGKLLFEKNISPKCSSGKGSSCTYEDPIDGSTVKNRSNRSSKKSLRRRIKKGDNGNLRTLVTCPLSPIKQSFHSGSDTSLCSPRSLKSDESDNLDTAMSDDNEKPPYDDGDDNKSDDKENEDEKGGKYDSLFANTVISRDGDCFFKSLEKCLWTLGWTAQALRYVVARSVLTNPCTSDRDYTDRTVDLWMALAEDPTSPESRFAKDIQSRHDLFINMLDCRRYWGDEYATWILESMTFVRILVIFVSLVEYSDVTEQAPENNTELKTPQSQDDGDTSQGPVPKSPKKKSYYKFEKGSSAHEVNWYKENRVDIFAVLELDTSAQHYQPLETRWGKRLFRGSELPSTILDMWKDDDHVNS